MTIREVEQLHMTIEIRDINPEPWTAPNVVRAKGGRIVAIKGGKNEAYQKALREAVESADAPPPGDQDLDISFYFWRSSEQGNVADATNLLKATEDGLQGVLYVNDRQNKRVSACIVEQGPDVEPRIVIVVQTFDRDRAGVPSRFDPKKALQPLSKTSTATPEREEDIEWRKIYDPASEF